MQDARLFIGGVEVQGVTDFTWEPQAPRAEPGPIGPYRATFTLQCAPDPLADLMAAVRQIKASTGGRAPNLIEVHPKVADELLTGTYDWFARKVKRLQKILRKEHVAGQQWKRRRQWVNGRFGRVAAKKSDARRQLPQAEHELARAWEALQQWRARKDADDRARRGTAQGAAEPHSAHVDARG